MNPSADLVLVGLFIDQFPSYESAMISAYSAAHLCVSST